MIDSLRTADGQMRDLYWKSRDLPAALKIAEDSIRQGLEFAQANPNSPELDALLGQVKTFAFNSACFAWPGWDEPGISPTPEQIRRGMDHAKLNLELALRLNRPPEKVRDAHWLLGAMHLAVGDRVAARAEFEAGEAISPCDLTRGYIALIDTLTGLDSDALENFIAPLDQSIDETKFIVDQLRTARQVFAADADH